MGIPENIDALLVKYDIKPDTLARIAEVSPASVSRWRHGGSIRDANLRKIVDYFGLSTDDILSDSAGLAAKEHGWFVAKPGNSDPALTEIVEIYDAMSDEGRRALLASARGLAMAYPGEEAPSRVARSA